MNALTHLRCHEVKHEYLKLKVLIGRNALPGIFHHFAIRKKQQLRRWLHRHRWQLVRLAGLTAAAALLQLTLLYSQGFSNAQLNPFGLTHVLGSAAPVLADIDGDGDQDIFIGSISGNVNYFENTGTAETPIFAAVVSNPFGLTSAGLAIFPTFSDLDGDGDQDAFIGNVFGNISYFENTGDAANPMFTSPVLNPFGLTKVEGFAVPRFVDLDGDGDLDAFVGDNEGNIIYFENTGDAINPAFGTALANPFGIATIGTYASPRFADLDGDGDLDAVFGENNGNIIYFENSGTVTNPTFNGSSINPFKLSNTGSSSMPAIADLDADGDLDVLVGNYSGNVNYFENILDNRVQPIFQMPVANPFGLTDVGGFVAPRFADIDGDGDPDAFVGERNGAIFYFENTGSADSPAFTTAITNPFGLTDIGSFVTPYFVDIDSDGDLDAFVGSSNGATAYFENTGDAHTPVFASPVNNPMGLQDAGALSSISFIDIDDDGDFDAFIGESNGNTLFFENTGTVTNPTFSNSVMNPMGLAGVGNNAAPNFADIDEDGDPDAFIGNLTGNTTFFENIGSATSPAFGNASIDPFNLLEVGLLAKPSFVDILGDGDLDIFIGNNFGNILYFDNETIPLPVELTYFRAKAVQQTALLTWATATETNNQGFDIQRSENGKAFKSIGFVTGAGTTIEPQSYRFVDQSPVVGLNYYRLKQLDTDGKFEYTDIVSVQFDGKGELQLSPNPVQDILQWTLDSDNEAVEQIRIYDQVGRLLKQTINSTSTLNVQDLPKGTYFLQLKTGRGEIHTAPFVKVR